MADTTVDSTNQVQKWADDEFFEYVRQQPFKRYMGTGENDIIQVKEDLTKDAGDSLTFSLVSRLQGNGVTGDNTLEGSEEAMNNYGHRVNVDQLRNAVVVGSFEKIKTKIDLLNAAKIMLRLWNMDQLRTLFINRFNSPNQDGTTTYASTSEADRDTWEAGNNPATTNQRILFGTAKSNQSGDHSADLANIDGTADDLHQDIVRLARRLAMTCDPHIRPVIDSDGNPRFVMFAGSLGFRDLEANMDTVHQNASQRGLDNRIFAGGDLLINNVIVHEVPEIPQDTGVGAGSIDVETAFFCGAQTLLLAWASRMQVKMDEFDYQNKRGVAVAEIRGCEKATYNNYQHGMVTVYVSSVGD